MNRDRFSGAGRFPRYLFSATKFLIFFALIAFVVTCSFLLFLDSMRLDPDILRENALLTFLNILLLSALFTVIDGIRRRLTVERPVRRIRAATQRIIQGDFSVRIEPLHGPERADAFDAIIEDFNQMARELSGVETLRMDADAIAMAGTHEALLQRFARERIPIMIGTQMITKGLNFENVTLVGVLNADQSLYVGDYCANERTFSLITQVVGRSGRGDAPGRAVIQTFTPANETIRQAARQDYDAFYRSEIALRQLNGTPPFSEVLAVTVSGAQENAVVRCCAYIRDYFRQTVGERAEVLGPAPLPVVRMNNRYRYRVTLYCNQSKAVRRAAANIVMYCNTEKSFRDVTVFADDNPLD